MIYTLRDEKIKKFWTIQRSIYLEFHQRIGFHFLALFWDVQTIRFNTYQNIYHQKNVDRVMITF